MVSFTCDICQDVLKKKAIDAHCRRGPCVQAWYFTCIDCNQVFEGFSYMQHTQCVSEKEKYEKGPKKLCNNISIAKSSSPSSIETQSNIPAVESKATHDKTALTTEASSPLRNPSTVDLLKWQGSWLDTTINLLKSTSEAKMDYDNLSKMVVKAYKQAHPDDLQDSNYLELLCLSHIPQSYTSHSDRFIRLPMALCG